MLNKASRSAGLLRFELRYHKVMGHVRPRHAGFTLIELIITVTIIAILTAMAVPLAKNSIQREKEFALRQALREIRTAIDKYKDYSDRGFIQVKLGTEGYPESLDVLVEGVPLNGAVDKKLKLLRRVPTDPMTNSTEWGLRAYQDDPKVDQWGGENVFDVHTKSEGTALDGSKYKDW
jgi:general secretion pathway protein G